MDLREKAAQLSIDEIAELLRFQALAKERAEQKERDFQHQIERLESMCKWLQNQLFGARSERRLLENLTPSDQLWLGQEMLPVPEEPPAPTIAVGPYEREQRKNKTRFTESDSRLKFGDDVPIQEIAVTNLAVEGIPAEELVHISDNYTYRLAQLPGSYVVLKYVQPVYRRKTADQVFKPSAPPAIFSRSIADVSFLAGMIVDKFQFHLPLYRQHLRLQQCGIDLTRSTMTRLVHRVAELLEPIYLATLSSILRSKVLAVDESPTPAGRANGRIKKGYFWAFYGDQDEIALMFSPSRAGQVLDKVLSSYEGVLLTDGYVVYEKFAKARDAVESAQCWAHTRRNFIDSEKSKPEESKAVLALFQDLYKAEEFAGSKPEQKAQLRKQHCEPIVDEIFKQLRRHSQNTILLPSNPFTQAVEYALARERELRVFLDNPDVQIDTNHIERTLRGPAVGRKNWMFNVTEVGARACAIFYTLIQSCILAKVHPMTYLVDVLQRIETHPAVDVGDLVPRPWAKLFGADPMRSDLCQYRPSPANPPQ
jgi:transposase